MLAQQSSPLSPPTQPPTLLPRPGAALRKTLDATTSKNSKRQVPNPASRLTPAFVRPHLPGRVMGHASKSSMRREEEARSKGGSLLRSNPADLRGPQVLTLPPTAQNERSDLTLLLWPQLGKKSHQKELVLSISLSTSVSHGQTEQPLPSRRDVTLTQPPHLERTLRESFNRNKERVTTRHEGTTSTSRGRAQKGEEVTTTPPITLKRLVSPCVGDKERQKRNTQDDAMPSSCLC